MGAGGAGRRGTGGAGETAKEEGGKEESCEADGQEKGTLIFQGRPGEGRDP